VSEQDRLVDQGGLDQALLLPSPSGSQHRPGGEGDTAELSQPFDQQDILQDRFWRIAAKGFESQAVEEEGLVTVGHLQQGRAEVNRPF